MCIVERATCPLVNLLACAFLFYLFGAYDFIGMRFGVVTVQQHGLKEVQLPNEDSRDAYKQDEHDETQGKRDFGHDDGASCQKNRPAVNHERGLPLVETLLDKPMLDVAGVGL